MIAGTPMSTRIHRKRRSSWWVACVVVLGLAGVVWLVLRSDPEPVYENRTVTEWSLDLISPFAATRTTAADRLRAIGPEAVPHLTRQLHRRDSSLKRPFIAVAPRLPVSWRRAFLRSLRLFDPADERLAAALALQLYGSHVPPEPLLRALRQDDGRLSSESATALAAVGPAAVPGLIDALEDPQPRVRALACYALSRMRPAPPEAAPALARRLTDPELQIAGQAAHALQQIGTPAVPHLIQVLQEADPRGRQHAALALGAMGRQGQPAVPTLLAALEDEEGSVREQARKALRNLAPDLVPEDPIE
jgi:HEAT repeat protein